MNVITPKPRNAKNVSATLADDVARPVGSQTGRAAAKSAFASVVTANTERMPMTTTTTTDWTLATACEPKALSAVIATMRSAAKAFAANPRPQPRSPEPA